MRGHILLCEEEACGAVLLSEQLAALTAKKTYSEFELLFKSEKSAFHSDYFENSRLQIKFLNWTESTEENLNENNPKRAICHLQSISFGKMCICNSEITGKTIWGFKRSNVDCEALSILK